MESSALLLIIVCLTFFVILICRELACWYFKINKRLEIEAEILKEAKKQTELLQGIQTNQVVHTAHLEAITSED